MAASLVATCPPSFSQAPPAWERLGGYPEWASDSFGSVLLLPAEDDPAHDDVFAVGTAGIFRYAPGEDNGEWEDWDERCYFPGCSPDFGVRTAQGTILIGAPGGPSRLDRSTDRGLTWDRGLTAFGPTTYFQSTIPALGGAIYIGIGGLAFRSLADGARGSWVEMGNTGGLEVTFAEIPPSPSLPDGRLLVGVWNGITYSDDGGRTFQASSAYGSAAYIAESFAFVAEEGHPFGGAVFAGVQDLAFYPESSTGAVLRSDDGGRTWSVAHRFDPVAWGLPLVRDVRVFTAGDGVLWAGLEAHSTGPPPHAGTIGRSTDGGVTWERADAGYGGYSVRAFALSRSGVLYAATSRGIWRTTTPVVAVSAEPIPPGSPDVGVSVRPNPALGIAEVTVSNPEPGPARVVVFDALGREVAVVVDGALPPGGRSVAVDTSSWPAGLYVVRAEASGQTASARLVVVR